MLLSSASEVTRVRNGGRERFDGGGGRTTFTLAELSRVSAYVLLLNWRVLPFAAAAGRAARLGSAELSANALLKARARLLDPLFLGSPSPSSTSPTTSTTSTSSTAFFFLFLRAPAVVVLPAPIELFSNAPWSAVTRAEELVLSPTRTLFLAATRCSRIGT